MQRQRHTLIGIEMLRLLARDGYRIFDIETARSFAKKVGISSMYLPSALTYLKQNNYIYTLKNGLYALDIAFLGGIPLHEHEIAMFLVKPAAISHFSSFQYHGLTDQIPFVVYISTLRGSKPPRLSNKTDMGDTINGTPYKFIHYKAEHYFGFINRWEGSTKIIYTDFERSLLDGLMHPHLCGGIQEVLYAFERNITKINIPRIVEYALKLETATAKRLGWVLDNLGIDIKTLDPLLSLPIKSYNKFNVRADSHGQYNRKWMIQENL